MRWENQFARRAHRITASEIRELLKVVGRPNLISFAGGIPDPALFPADGIAAAYERILRDTDARRAALQYSVSEGYPPLRDWIAAYMRTKGVVCSADNILITNGSQQALDFIGKLFVDPGDKILVDQPTYLGALQAFNAYEPRYGVLPIDARDGDASAKLAYVVPDFCNPSGRTLTLAEREALLAAAERNGFAVVEDAAYELLRYEGAAVPPLLALSAERAGGIEDACVLYCGSFSKTVAPGLRLGWLAAPHAVIRKLVLIKQGADLNCSALTQMVMAETADAIVARAEHLRAAYRTRRDAMLSALAEVMPEGAAWTRPEGGMFVWLTLPPGIDTAVLLNRAIARGIAFVPGHAFFTGGTGRNTLRLSFSLAAPDEIRTGIGRLAELIRESNMHRAVA